MKSKNALLSAMIATLVLVLPGLALAQAPTLDISASTVQAGSITDYLNANVGSVTGACYDSGISTGFACLTQAVNQTGLSAELSSAATQYTLFAPTDAAFKALASQMTPAEWDALFTDAAALRGLLSDHLVPARFTLNDMLSRTDAAYRKLMLGTVNGSQLFVTFEVTGTTGTIMIGDAPNISHVLEAVELDNGVLIAIDNVVDAQMILSQR